MERIVSEIDLEVAHRLRSGDSSVLSEIWRTSTDPVRKRLSIQFGDILNVHDLDDVLSTALYRLWAYRDQYRPEKSSLKSWLYVLARNSAVDLLRRQKRTRQVLNEDRIELAPAKMTPTRSAAQQGTIQLVRSALENLSDVDQRIVLRFAESQGDSHWSDGLTEELAMPASTLRSRKMRAIARLKKTLMADPSAVPLLKEIPMATGAAHVAPQSNECLNDSQVDELIRLLSPHFPLRKSTVDESTLRVLASEWNEVRTEESEGSRQANLNAFQANYLWQKTLERDQNASRAMLKERLLHWKGLDATGFTRSTLATLEMSVAIDRLEIVFADLVSSLELAMPTNTRRAGAGRVALKWSADDVALSWAGGEQSLSLRSLLKEAVREGASLRAVDEAFLIPAILREFREGNACLLADYSFALADQNAPENMHWKRHDPELIASNDLPGWLASGDMPSVQPMPKQLGIEADLLDADGRLAEVVDETLCAAARLDFQSREGGDSDERSSAVDSLLTRVAMALKIPREDVAGIFVPLLMHQQQTATTRSCAANTTALAYLLEQTRSHE